MELINPRDFKRFLTVMSLTQKGGSDLIKGLELARTIVESDNCKEGIQIVCNMMREGESIYHSFEEIDMLPLYALNIIGLGSNNKIEDYFSDILKIENLIGHVDFNMKKNLLLFFLCIQYASKDGYSLSDSILFAGQGMESEAYVEASKEMAKQVKEGAELHVAMLEHRDIFPEVYLRMMEIALIGGISIFEVVSLIVESEV